MLSKRDIRLDIIRIFSLFCIISVHFLLNSGFYQEIVDGKRMLFMCIIRSLFIICVPMFITLSGYLLNKKELSKKYYKGLIDIILIYIICSLLYFVFKFFYFNNISSFNIFIEDLLSFKGTRYAWYIELYIGLFLIIPFLNLIFNNLKNKKQAKILLVTLLVLSGIPNIINIFNFSSMSWWANPAFDNDYFKILPSWWISIYPLFYYFLGAYLSKYKININTKLNILLIFIVIILDGIFNYYRFNGSYFVSTSWNNYSSALVMLKTFLIFNLFLKINIKIKSKSLNNLFKTISNACLCAYLTSGIFDTIYYNFLNTSVPIIKERFIYAPLIVTCVFISSLVLGILINFLYESLKKLYYNLNIKGLNYTTILFFFLK